MRREGRVDSPARLDAANRTVLAALTVLLLTTVHHVYGAYVYGTPWRNHVAYVSGLSAAAIAASVLVLRRRPAGLSRAIALTVLTLVTLAIPVIGIGLFEGGYNHVLKDALYFGGASLETMRRLFPPPAYELPNDAFFEVTGVLQLFAGVLTGHQLYRLVQRSAGGRGWRDEATRGRGAPGRAVQARAPRG